MKRIQLRYVYVVEYHGTYNILYVSYHVVVQYMYKLGILIVCSFSSLPSVSTSLCTCPFSSPLQVDTLLYFQGGVDLNCFTLSRCHWVKERLSMLCEFTDSLLPFSSGDVSEDDVATVHSLAAMHSQVYLCVFVKICIPVQVCIIL